MLLRDFLNDVARMNLACEIALSAVKIVSVESTGSQREIDIKRYARVEKIPGGSIEDSEVLQGVMFSKDVTHTRMRRFLPTISSKYAYQMLTTPQAY